MFQMFHVFFTPYTCTRIYTLYFFIKSIGTFGTLEQRQP